MNASAPEEISLGSLLAVLYRQRAFIASGILAVSAIAAVASLFWPKTYEASAEILVSPAGYKKTMLLIPEPYSVVTYEKIADNPNLKLDVVRQLRELHDALGKHQPIDPRLKLTDAARKGVLDLPGKWLADLGTVSIHDWMEVKTYIEEETNLGVKYANLITLVARAPNKEAAAVLANLWQLALLDLDATSTRQEADANIQSTTTSRDRVQAQMKEISDRRQDTPSLARGEQFFNELETLNATLYGKTETQTSTEPKTGATTQSETLADTGLYGQRQLAEQRVDARQKGIARLTSLIEQQEEEGRWIGDSGVIQDPGRALEAEDTRRRGLQAELVQVASRIAQLSAQVDDLATVEKDAYDAFLTYHIRNIRPLKEEDKPIPADRKAEDDRRANVHNDAMQARKAKDAEVEAAKARQTTLQNALLALSARTDVLSVLAAVKNHLSGEAAGASSLEQLRQRYHSYQEALTQANTDLLAAQSERDSLARRIQELERRRDALQLDANRYLIERDNLERKLKLSGAFFDNEQNLARLVEADAAELLRSPNLKPSSIALPPNQRVSPKRARMVLLGAFGAAVVFTLLAFVREGLANLPEAARRGRK